MTVPKTQPIEQYIFDSFLPYRDALHLSRWVQGLMVLGRLLRRGGPIAENFCWGAGLSARHIAPQLRPAGQSEEGFRETLSREAQHESFNEEELRDFLEDEAEELRAKIDSGEIDIWDDTPVWVAREEVEDFISRSLEYLETKICSACNGEESLLERLIPQAVECLRRGNDSRELYAGLLVWDYARMYYEGEPPYRVVFSPQVAETLGIDPQMESVKMQKMRPLARPESRRLRVARAIVLKGGGVMTVAELSTLSGALELDRAVLKYFSKS